MYLVRVKKNPYSTVAQLLGKYDKSRKVEGKMKEGKQGWGYKMNREVEEIEKKTFSIFCRN